MSKHNGDLTTSGNVTKTSDINITSIIFIISSTAEFYKNNDQVIINFYENGRAEIVVDIL